MKKESNTRLIDIDIARAIGIILVVWAHACAPFSEYITAFHMPFFFFLSGMLFSEPKKYREYVQKKIRAYLVPFWIWNILLWAPFEILYYWKNWDVKSALLDLLKIIITVDKVPMLGATWFLPALFWVSIIFALLYRLLDKIKFRTSILLFIGICVFITGIVFTFPFRISRVLICSFYYVLGYFAKKYLYPAFDKSFSNKKRVILLNIIALMCLISFIFMTNLNEIDLGANIVRIPFLFFIGTILATYSVGVVSKDISIMKKSIIVKHLIFIGKNTLPVVIWQFVFFRVAILIQIIVLKAPIKEIFAFPVYDASKWWWILYLLTGLYGSILFGVVEKSVIRFLKDKRKKE